MRTLFLLLTFASISISYSQENIESHKNIDSTNFNTIYPFALRGEMSTVFSIFESLEDNKITKKQRLKKQKYYDRFVTVSEDFDYRTNNPVIVNLYDRFQNYWRSILVENVDQELADSLFYNEMVYFLKIEHYVNLSVDSIKSNLFSLFRGFFIEEGFHGIAMGKTGHIYDLYLWKDENEVIYDIQLPETKVQVPVVFMNNFISYGWTHYATLGRSSTGGWTFPSRLYCVEESYDKSSEKFMVSYVAHEGQHFADMKTYPKLKQADLEYRAKLTELSLANKSILTLIERFKLNAKNDKSRAHAYANYLVVKNLSSSLFKGNYDSDKNNWKGISVEKINKIAYKFLQEHTIELNNIGAETVESCIL